jgi:amino acid transporter
MVDQALVQFGLDSMSQTGSWEKFQGGFGALVAVTAPVFWVFFLLTGIALFVLRWKDPATPRPFTVPLYPIIPILFCATSVYMLDKSIRWAGQFSWLGAALLAVGVVLYGISLAMERGGPASVVENET